MIAGLALAVGVSSATALPTDRAYEMVSPPEKNYSDVGNGGLGGSYRASADGTALLYSALGGWGDATSNSISGMYLAKRGETAWTSHSALLPMFPLPLFGGGGVAAYTPDFSRVISYSNLDFETGGEAVNEQGNTYIFDPFTKERERLTPDALDGISRNPGSTGSYFGNADFSKVVFSSEMVLAPGGEALIGNQNRLYRYVDGELTLEGRKPNGDPVNGSFFTSTFEHQGTNPVSADANVAFFKDGAPPIPIYRRDMSGPVHFTDMVNADENSLEDPPSASADFVGASKDGQVAFFSSTQRLVDEDTDSTADVYRYEQAKPEGSRLTLISVDSEPGDTASATGNTFGATDDGETVYFNSTSQLVEGETTTAGTKLFAWHDGDLRFIALTGAAVAPFDAVQSENGKYFGFLASGAGITPEDNGGQAQAYLYEVASGDIACASCLGGGEANTVPASWRRQPAATQLAPTNWYVRNVSNDGDVFFETEEALVGPDTNGKRDIYHWEDGAVELLTTGRDTDNSWFLDASANGDTAFVLTRSQLSGWDTDDLYDAYAARVGGGLPEPPPDYSVPCEGDACQGPPSQPPVFPSVGSGVTGPGNPDAERSDCKSLGRKAERQAERAERLGKKAKRLGKKAKRASGQRAKRLTKKSNRAKRQARKSNRQARATRRDLAQCRQGVDR